MLRTLFSQGFFLGLALTTSYIRPSHQRSIEPRQSDSLQWGPCHKPNRRSEASSLVCANFTVPLDWTNTSNEQKAVLYVAKRKARNGRSLGTIFVNPGGPGGSGFDFLYDAPSELLSNITGGNFDIVSWDPRGVGMTTPAINCFDAQGDYSEDLVAVNSQIYLSDNTLNARSNGPDQMDINTFLGNATNIEGYMQAIIQKCVEKNQDNLKFVGTVATVKDLVALADVIEGPGNPIRYWGFSYGTVIGSYLLDLFPNRVGRVVLDGVVDTTIYSQKPPYQIYADLVQDAEIALQAFYDACAVAGPDLCAIAKPNSTGATIRQWANDLIDTAYVGPRSEVANITPTSIRSLLTNIASLPTMWEDLAGSLALYYYELHGIPVNSTTVRKREVRHLGHSVLTKRQEEFDYPYASIISSSYAIWCGDSADETGVSTTAVFNEITRVTKEVTNVVGPLALTFTTSFCHIWKARAVERHYDQGSPRLANPVLVIGNTYDPITPLASARKLVSRLNAAGTRQAALIQHDGTGHLSLEMNSVCTYTIVQRYFTDGTFPEDTLCGTNFRGFTGNPYNGNHNTTSSIISAPLPSASLPANTLGNGALASTHLTFFHTAFAFLLGAISMLLSM
ncbi:hypothetical protein FRC02_011936 [Tulasnella sp. 418]|nr:hypothetical protein FRC02_011936 [Tulasnella sp. 418]